MDDSETVWVERKYVGHGFRDDDLSRLRTEHVVFDECDFRGVNLTSPNPYRDNRDRYRDMARSLGFDGHIAWAEAMP